MKKSLLIIAALGIQPLWLKAQPNIVQADFPTVGDFWVEFQDNRVGMHTITLAGPSQAWDYSTAFVIDDTSGTNFILPSAVPNGWGASFPNADLAVYSAFDTTAQFFKSMTNGFYADGLYTGSVTSPMPAIDFDPDQLMVPGNFTYNSTRTNTTLFILEQIGPPNFQVRLYNIQNFLGDAWGSLITPDGTFPSTLRIREISYTIDSTFMDQTGTGTYVFVNSGGASDSTYNYNWLKNGSHPLLMTISYDATAAQTTYAAYTSLTPVGVSENPAVKSEVNVYPNPASTDWVHFTFENAEAQLLRVYTVEGKLVKEVTVTGVNNLTLSTASFNKGMYIYEAIGTSGQRLATGRFAIAK